MTEIDRLLEFISTYIVDDFICVYRNDKGKYIMARSLTGDYVYEEIISEEHFELFKKYFPDNVI